MKIGIDIGGSHIGIGLVDSNYDLKQVLQEELKDKFYNCNYVFYKNNMPKIVIGQLGNDAGIIGSALFA